MNIHKLFIWIIPTIQKDSSLHNPTLRKPHLHTYLPLQYTFLLTLVTQRHESQISNPLLAHIIYCSSLLAYCSSIPTIPYCSLNLHITEYKGFLRCKHLNAKTMQTQAMCVRASDCQNKTNCNKDGNNGWDLKLRYRCCWRVSFIYDFVNFLSFLSFARLYILCLALSTYQLWLVAQTFVYITESRKSMSPYAIF